MSIAGWIVGGELAYSYVGGQLTLLFGKPSAELVLAAMRGSQTTEGTWATAVSVVMLLVGASTVFAARLASCLTLYAVSAARAVSRS